MHFDGPCIDRPEIPFATATKCNDLKACQRIFTVPTGAWIRTPKMTPKEPQIGTLRNHGMYCGLTSISPYILRLKPENKKKTKMPFCSSISGCYLIMTHNYVYYLLAAWYLSEEGSDTMDCGTAEVNPCVTLSWMFLRAHNSTNDSTFSIYSDKSLTINPELVVRKVTCSPAR